MRPSGHSWSINFWQKMIFQYFNSGSMFSKTHRLGGTGPDRHCGRLSAAVHKLSGLPRELGPIGHLGGVVTLPHLLRSGRPSPTLPRRKNHWAGV